MMTATIGYAQQVSDIRYTKVDKELTITYSLDKAADIRLRVSTDGGKFFSEPIQNLSGDVGKGIKPGTDKQIIAYDMREIRGIDIDSLLVFLVEVDDGSLEVNYDGIRFKMIPVKGGTFTMGRTKTGATKHNYDADRPTHKVTVDDFLIGQCEVTQRLWVAVMDTNPSRWQYNDSLPVEQVSWNEAQIFISRLSQLTGYRFRLPSEAEWEYAARGGVYNANNTYPGTSGDLGSVAWYGSNADNHTHPVGRLKPNELGLYDMAGNVWEWCIDWMADYTAEPQENPRGPKNGENKILRGGSMNSPSWGCTVWDRSWYLPDYGYGFHGFRLVLDNADRED